MSNMSSEHSINYISVSCNANGNWIIDGALPKLSDCDEQGRCWWWYPPVPEKTYGYWTLEDNATERAYHEWPIAWLNVKALPIPKDCQAICF